MPIRSLVTSCLLLTSSFALAQASSSETAASLPARTTIPIAFTKTISAAHAHAGDAVEARTTQIVRLPGGLTLRPGTTVHGHVVTASAFTYDRTPYTHRRPSLLTIHFDSLQLGATAIPLSVSVRAVASPIATADARRPAASDMDPDGTVRQVGGDYLTPSQSEVVNGDGDVVAYNRRDGVYAHLIASGSCDGGDVEVSVGIFSPHACGLYGFSEVSAAALGSSGAPSQMTLVSTHTSPELWKNTSALLEVIPGQAR